MQHFLLECAVRALLVAVGTAAALVLLRVKSPGVRHAAWTAVLALMLLLPAWMAWGPRVSLPFLPAPPRPMAVAPIAFQLPDAPLELPAQAPAVPRAHWNWLAIVYFTGVFVLLARLTAGTVRALMLVHSATLRDGHLTSAVCAAPVTVGWLRPAMILPANWRAWPLAQLDAVLAHESAHIRRRDPLVQWLALLNRAIFWFHPLAWWLEHRLSALAEEACDAAVLARGCDPHDYSGYLLELARTVVHSGARVRSVGMAMPGSSLPYRIRQILTRRETPRVSRARALCLIAACATVSTLFATANLDRQAFVPDPPLPAAPPSTAISKAELTEPAQEAQPQPPREKRLMVLYFDLDGTVPDIQARARAAALGMIQKNAASDEVSIMTCTNGVVKVMQDFTADRGKLVATVQQIANNPDAEPAGVAGLHTAVHMFSAIPEKKMLIYFAVPALRVSASPNDISAVVFDGLSANVAFFPIDVTGFAAGAGGTGVIQAGDALSIALTIGRMPRGGRKVVRVFTKEAQEAYDAAVAPFQDQPFTVQPDGTVSIPNLGDVHAGGLTIAQLESTIGPALAARLSSSHLPVTGVTIEKH